MKPMKPWSRNENGKATEKIIQNIAVCMKDKQQVNATKIVYNETHCNARTVEW